MKRMASVLKICRLRSSSSCLTFSMNRAWVVAFSTAVTDAAPRDSNSMLTAPVPAKRSRHRSPSISTMFSITLNMFSRAKSVVGRAVMFVGTLNRLRPYLPRIILIFFRAIAKRCDN